MFTWVKKLFNNSDKEKAPSKIYDKLIQSMTRAQAIYEITYEHLQNIEQGNTEYPAQKRKSRNVLEIWTFSRIEAFFPFLISKHSNILLLSDLSKQKEILNVWFVEKPHLAFPHSITENEIEETVKSVFKVYIEMAKIVEEVGADEIGRGGKLFDSFNEKMKELKNNWDNEQDITNLPLIFDILFEDITSKTKIIALCSVFGPDYSNMMDTLIQHVAESLKQEGKSEKEVNESIEKSRKKFAELLLKKDPDK